MTKREQQRTEPAPADDAAPLDETRQRVPEPLHHTRASVMRDLEAAKLLAFEDGNAAAFVRATELQGKPLGAFDVQTAVGIRQIADAELIAMLAGDCKPAAEILTDLLEKGEWIPPRLDRGPATPSP